MSGLCEVHGVKRNHIIRLQKNERFLLYSSEIIMDAQSGKRLKVHLVSSSDSPEFALLNQALTRTSLVGLDAEWKPVRAKQTSFPTVSLLQIACQLNAGLGGVESGDSVVFLLDLFSIPLSLLWESLRDLLASPDILKLGFRFKQDLVYLSSTFYSQGCDPGFDKVDPYLDITTVYNHLPHKKHGRSISKQIKSLSTICGEVLGFSLSKELQCSDWSCRPLTEEQMTYAALDAHCLLEIFNVFKEKIVIEGNSLANTDELSNPGAALGLKEVFRERDVSNQIVTMGFCEASSIVQASAYSDVTRTTTLPGGMISKSSSYHNTMPMDEILLKIVNKYGEKLLLKESDKMPKTSKKKANKRSSTNGICKEKQLEKFDEWQGVSLWDLSVGGDGCPRFLCDVMVSIEIMNIGYSLLHVNRPVELERKNEVEGLAKHLRCVGIDAAIPYSKKPEPRELIEQARKEKRVLLTRDAKLLRHEYLITNQIYKVKSLLKNDQLLEVIETFQLKISEDQLMSRCTKCNGRFIQKPLSTEEAIHAAKGFQRIPSCLFNKNLEFWQCMDCHQLYWEGTQYQNAVQKFIDVCKLSD